MAELQSISPYWIWLALACLFLAVEVLVVPSGFFLCMGTAAGIMAALTFAVPDFSLLWSLTLYAFLLVVACGVWWNLLRKKFNSGSDDGKNTLNVKTRQLVGYRTTLTEALKDGRGKIRVNDSPWPVEADDDYPAGTKVEVIEVKGITLVIRNIL